MQPFRLVLMFFVLAAACLLPAQAGTYRLTDGSTATGEPVAYGETGLILRDTAGLNPRVPWARFTQDSLKQIAEEAKSPKDRAFVEPFIEDWVREQEMLRQIVVKEPDVVPARPTGTKGLFALFSSPLGLVLVALAYLANIWAGYELAVFRNQSTGMGLGLGLVPIVGPLVFAFIPTKAAPPPPEEPEESEIPPAEPAPAEAAAGPAPVASAVAVPPPQAVMKKKGQAPTITLGTGATDIGLAGTAGAATAAAPASAPAVASDSAAASQVQVFEKGKFIFNRRFFETKMPGFFRAVPRDEDKDLVVVIKAVRGEFVGKRITSIDQSQLALQVFKGGVTADETIPFMEIQEVRIQPQAS
jgi:hypothetical protein